MDDETPPPEEPFSASSPGEDDSQPLSRFTEQAYLDYAMYVIHDRALPRLSDGLKPVQRRIVYAMSELGLASGAKPKKSARTVGDVIGKFHPHGDTACYEAMVHMAQPFTYRYPLVDGQGNWGASDDPKSFAAMRYTEARLTPFAELLLGELQQGTVDWQPNFDGTLEEPVWLPARVPHLLLNGTHGIAVGMSTDIPPHNLGEVGRACIHLLQHPRASLEEVCQYLPAPDFPGGGEIITPAAELRAIYASGAGSLRVRASYEIQDGAIVISELPYQTSGSRVLEQIAAQMQAKKLPLVEDLRDESDQHSPVRLVIVPRSNRVDCARLMEHLYATTELERSYRVNFNCIASDGKPAVKGLLPLLKEWLEQRRETVRRRLEYRLNKVIDRLHVLDGLLIAFLNIDEVIAIIRAEDDPKPVLISRFALTDTQAEAVLELRLRHLARLEEMQLRGEHDKLAAERASLSELLDSPRALTRLLRDEMAADVEKYGDERRSRLVERGAARALEQADLAPSEPVTVVLSAGGWLRVAKGHDIDATGLTYRAGDSCLGTAQGRSNQPVYLLDNSGRAYQLDAATLPSARGHGEPASGRLKLPEGASLVAVLMGDPDSPLLLTSSAGYGFATAMRELQTRNRAGKALLKVSPGASALPPVRLPPQAEQIAVAANNGRLLLFDHQELPRMTRGKGVKLLALKAADGEQLVAAVGLVAGQSLKVFAGNRHITIKPADLAAYVGTRGRRGKLLPRGFQRVTGLAGG